MLVLFFIMFMFSRSNMDRIQALREGVQEVTG